MTGLVGVVNNSIAQNGTISSAGTTFVNYANLLDSCVMCQTPFGKQLNVKLVDTSTGQTLSQARMIQQHITVTLRLMFLANDPLESDW